MQGHDLIVQIKQELDLVQASAIGSLIKIRSTTVPNFVHPVRHGHQA